MERIRRFSLYVKIGRKSKTYRFAKAAHSSLLLIWLSGRILLIENTFIIVFKYCYIIICIKKLTYRQYIALIVSPFENRWIHYFDILNPSCSKLIIKTMLKKNTLVGLFVNLSKLLGSLGSFLTDSKKSWNKNLHGTV